MNHGVRCAGLDPSRVMEVVQSACASEVQTIEVNMTQDAQQSR